MLAPGTTTASRKRTGRAKKPDLTWKNLTPEVDVSRIEFSDKMQSQASRQGIYVLFSPRFQQRAKSVQPGLAWGMLEDDAALLHELFHALRILQGRLNLSPMITTMEKSARAKAETYRNREELYATVVQNFYSAELARNALRENHNNLTQPGNYLSGRTIAGRLRRTECSDLEHVPLRVQSRVCPDQIQSD